MGTGAGFGEHLACEESCPIGGNIPAVLQEESLEMMHLFTDTLTGAQILQIRQITMLKSICNQNKCCSYLEDVYFVFCTDGQTHKYHQERNAPCTHEVFCWSNDVPCS